MAEKKKPAAKPVLLPPEVLKEDTEYLRHAGNMSEEEYAAWRKKDSELNAVLKEMVGEDHAYRVKVLTLHKIKGGRTGDHWVVATLPISKSKNGFADRTYAIGVEDGKVYRVGKGPHVVATVEVHVRPENFERVKRYVELYAKGLENAGVIRDRISTRRAMGALYRAEGRSSWSW